jgi:titin
MVGGTNSGARNVISGNGGFGILVVGEFTTNAIIQGNFIGSDLNGNVAISNTWDGIAVFDGSALIGGSAPCAGNLISGNGSEGISIAGTNFNYSVVQGNLIGVDISGANALSNAFGGININGKSNLIGGTLPAMRNIISGNGGSGVSFFGLGTTDNRVEGNFIGLNPSGTEAIPNLYAGVSIGFGAQSNIVGGGIGTRNFISGNSVYGISIIDTNTSGNLIQGNTIGLDSANGAAVPNGFDGVLIANAQSNQIGGLAPGVGNIIAGNSNYAVISFGASATNNSIRANSIFAIGFEGIRFFDKGNRSIGAPNLSSANLTTNLNVFGHVTLGANSSVELDFYASPFSPVSTQGKTYLGTRSISSDIGGTTDFSFALNALVSAEQIITATVTDSDGNTSPFSDGVEISSTSSANDGIPDAWRALYFGGNGTATNNQSCATCDPDGDGASNSEEFFAGTNPTNAASFFQLNSLLTQDGIVVDLPSANGISYRLESRDAFETNSWSILADQIIGTGTNIFVTDPAATVLTKRFYRARILP